MTKRTLLSDPNGAAAIEFTFALPILLMLMIAILQFGLVLQASGAMRNAVGEGIRHAKVHPTATETEVLNRARAGFAGVDPDGIQTLTFTRGTSNGAEFGRISMTYHLTPLIPFASVPPIQLSATRTAYLQR
jgi:Flp pilus assembly protein TadG